MPSVLASRFGRANSIIQRDLNKFKYDCPFNILYDFDRWFEFQSRVQFNKQSSADALWEMLKGNAGEIQKWRQK